MDNYDNPEGLEPEDYVEEYGEAGHCAWGGDRKKQTVRKHHSHQKYDDGDVVFGVIVVVVIGILLMIFIFG